MVDNKDWYTVDELRVWLGLGKTKAAELVASGEIPSYKIGKLRRIRKVDIEQWLERCKYTPGDQR